MCPAEPIITLPQNTSWFYSLRKLEQVLWTVCLSMGLDSANKILNIIYLVRLPTISWKELKQAPQVYIMISRGTPIKLVTVINLIISIIYLYPHLAYRTIQSISFKFYIEKLAAQLESQFLMPMPIFAYLMASKSFAPSPTIPTLSISSQNIRFQRVKLFLSLQISLLKRFTTSAFFSGEVRANTFIRGFIFKFQLN